jgi:alpha-mannosidase
MAWPDAELNAALHDLLTAEFHDILPGSSIQPVEETSLRLLDHGLELVSRAKARAFFALAAGQPKAAEGEIPILVYNPHPYVVPAIVECEFQLADQNWNDTFTDARVYRDGARLPTQIEKEAGNLPLDWRKRVAFAAELRPSQMNRFDCRLEVLPQRPPMTPLDPEAERFTFANDTLEAVINLRTGLLERYRVGGVDFLKAPAGEALVMADSEDAWAMLVRRFDTVVGRFQLMSPEDSARFSGVKAECLPAVRVVEDGEVRTVIEAVFGYGRSALVLRYKLPKVGGEIEVEARVQWADKDRLLKLAVPVAGSELKYFGQVAYGVGELPCQGDEAVAQKWVAVVADGKSALTCINDGVHGSDCSEEGLRLTLLRSPAYTGHPIGERSIVPQDRFTARLDQGERLFRFWLNAGPADERLARVDREALARNEKPMALSFFPSGQGESPLPLVRVSDDLTQIMAAKRSEDGAALVLRLFEPTGEGRETTMEVPSLGIAERLKLGAFEIRTLRVDLGTRRVVEANLLEEPV